MVSATVDSRRLETLITINELINSNYGDLNTLLTRIIESANLLTNGIASSLMLVSKNSDRLYFEISVGPKSSIVKQHSIQKGEGIAGWVVENNKSQIVHDVSKDKRFCPEIDRLSDFTTEAILAVPMRIRGDCVGVIEVINKQDGSRFTDEDLQWLEVFANQAAIAIENAKSYQKVQNEVTHLQDKLIEGGGYHTFVTGKSEVIREKLDILNKISDTNSPVLILGESGVGKELFAEQIHLRSSRRDGPFVRVNCAALPENLLESELFGHVKGAFTDAVSDRMGRFEVANGGTIFLDEIGDVPLGLQGKLLRVLQNRIVERVGSSVPIQLDVRILVATNKNLEEQLRDETFRRDLYYRLNVLPFNIPPLRARIEDIQDLAHFFLKRFCRETNKQIFGFTQEAMEMLYDYQWPGNVRELENVIERAVVLAEYSKIEPDNLILSDSVIGQGVYSGKSFREATTLFKRYFIKSVLEEHSWKQVEAAKVLGINRTYLCKLIRDLDVPKVSGDIDVVAI